MIKKISLFLSLIISCNLLQWAQIKSSLVLPVITEGEDEDYQQVLDSTKSVLLDLQKRVTSIQSRQQDIVKQIKDLEGTPEYKNLQKSLQSSQQVIDDIDSASQLSNKYLNAVKKQNDLKGKSKIVPKLKELESALSKLRKEKVTAEKFLESAKAAAAEAIKEAKAVADKAAAAKAAAAKEKTDKVRAADDKASKLAIEAIDKAKEKESAYAAARSDKAKVAAGKAIELAVKNHQIAQDKFNQALAELNRLREEVR